MRKVLTVILSLVLVFAVVMPALAFATPLDSVPKRAENGEEFVPLRQVAYAYDAIVEWDGENRAIHITNLNGYSWTVFPEDAGGFIENGTTWVPYGYVVEILDILTGQITSPICFEKAFYLFERLNTILDGDGGNLWGISLHGPVVIADAVTRYAVANMPDVEGEIFTRQGGLYVGQLPEGTHIGNTASFFGDRLWGMVTWGLIEANADDFEQIVDTILHELFHAQQPEIFRGHSPHNGMDVHMRELDARISIRLEINALLMALHATGNERVTAVHDALSIRAERRRLYPDSAYDEIRYELVEGTAVYTEAALGRDNIEDRIALVEKYMNMNIDHIVSQYGYHTGALYSLLLDEYSIDWRNRINWKIEFLENELGEFRLEGEIFESELAAILKEGIGFTEIIPFEKIVLERYGYSEIRLQEEAWIVETKRLTQEAWDALSGTLLFVDAMGEFGQGQDENVWILFLQGLGVHYSNEFDYGNDGVFLLVDERSYERTVFYGDFTYAAEFGELEFTSGFLMLWRAMWRHGIPADGLEIDGDRIIGSNWVLTLNEGFELRKVGGGHYAIKGSTIPSWD
jgi:hypothetical protein